jgi:hypothetical protein
LASTCGSAAPGERMHADHARMAADRVAVRAGWAAFDRLYEARVDADQAHAYLPAAAAPDESARGAIGREMAARRRVTRA